MINKYGPQFLSISLDLFFVANYEGYLTETNSAWEKTLGWSIDELRKRPLIEFVHADDQVSTLVEFGRLSKSGVMSNFRNRFLNKDGSYKSFSWQVTADLNNKILYGMARDITDENKNKKRENFLNSVFGVIPQLVAYVDREYFFRYANASYERWFGIDSEVCIGKKMAEVIGETGFELAKPYIDCALAGQSQVFEQLMPYKIGGDKSVRINYIPDYAQEGAVDGIFAIITDLSEIKKASFELSKSEMSFKLMFDNSPLGMLKLDKNFKFLAANSAFQSIVEYSQAELLELTIFDVTHQEDKKISTHAFAKFAGNNEILQRFEKRYVAKSGKIVWCLISSRFFKLSEQEEGYYLSTVEDITTFKEAELERQIVEAKLISASKMSLLGEMAGGIAHEINNPLSIILGKMSQIKRKVNGEGFDKNDVAQDILKVENTVERVTKVVKGMRAFSRNSEFDPMLRTPLFQIISDTLEICRQKFKNQMIDLSVNCDSEIELECRSSQISQIIMNLLSNAHDAVIGFPEKWVKLDVSLKCDMGIDKVQVQVTDSGKGIPPSVVEKMMQPFFTTKGVGKGTGLGLSISLGIAQDHKGSLRYDFDNKNTSFILELPVTQPS